MHLPMRAAAAVSLMALPFAVAIGAIAVHAQSVALHVVMIDNEAPTTPPGDPGRGYYGFAPQHFAVVQGQQIVFDNPSSNVRPHSVTSISWSGGSPYDTLETGKVFDSSPTLDDEIQPGSSWTLETASMTPGQYLYFCNLHPWMTGTFTVQPAAS